MRPADFEELKGMLEEGIAEPQIMARFTDTGYEPKEVLAAISKAKKKLVEKSRPGSVEEVMEKEFGLDEEARGSKHSIGKDVRKAFFSSTPEVEKKVMKALKALLAIIALLIAYMVYTSL